MNRKTPTAAMLLNATFTDTERAVYAPVSHALDARHRGFTVNGQPYSPPDAHSAHSYAQCPNWCDDCRAESNHPEYAPVTRCSCGAPDRHHVPRPDGMCDTCGQRLI